jgi:hypothetical protein
MNTLSFILDPLKTVFSIIGGYIPIVLGVLAALVIGSLIAREVGKLVSSTLKSIHVDKISHTIGLDHVLTTGGIKRPVSELIGTVITWGITITALVIALSYARVPVIGPATDAVMGYVPTVLMGVVTLMVGIFLAHIVSVFIRVIAANTAMPKPEMLASFTKWAVVLMALGVFVDKIGFGYLFTGTPLVLMIASLALALGLSFGLGGRDHAAHYLDKLLKK